MVIRTAPAILVSLQASGDGSQLAVSTARRRPSQRAGLGRDLRRDASAHPPGRLSLARVIELAPEATGLGSANVPPAALAVMTGRHPVLHAREVAAAHAGRRWPVPGPLSRRAGRPAVAR